MRIIPGLGICLILILDSLVLNLIENLLAFQLSYFAHLVRNGGADLRIVENDVVNAVRQAGDVLGTAGRRGGLVVELGNHDLVVRIPVVPD